jgi:hypothetical protein
MVGRTTKKTEEAKPKVVRKTPKVEQGKYMDPYTKSLLDQGFRKDEETGDWVKDK